MDMGVLDILRFLFQGFFFSLLVIKSLGGVHKVVFAS